ncbi:PREDICTED: uncharacterized PE-PGRS family protein PE_PGRS54-like isoform X2 [Polistes dominula]|uniref:Uncharacterized PE-PGRS family protein PE_PGRS54-like isoform X2 n=1 Tax=Polistes dominula TaxID=743375 RepID=A0ABM1INW1_POLDO|nr:PREDICTED: uncharacterized PE-PGRS family protein PE_PGRS54-like isoform X2 [Polistes dominula]
MTDNIYLRCSIIVLLCATTFATAGGFGSFAGSSSSAFSSASSNAQATGSVASAISSANAFTGGAFPSKNPDGTSHGLTHQQGISVGSGSFVGIHPGSDKFGLNHQGSSGVKGAHNNHKSQSPCSQCAHTKEKWDYDNYDEQPEEKDEETHGEDDDCDDGQYRPEHHYKHDNSGDGKEHEEETVPGVYKVGNTDQYDYDQENDKGAYTPGGNKGQGNNNYGNTGLTGANNQNSNNNNGDYQHSTKYPFAHPNAGASKDFSHLTINPSDFHKKKENDNKNVGTPGVVAPTLGAGGNYGNANKGPFGSPTPSQTNLGSVGGTNGGCSKSGSGGGCSTSETDSNLHQGPVKIGQTQLPQGSVAPSFNTGENKGTPGCKSLDGNCGIGKIDGTGQYQSTSVGSGQNLQSGYNGGLNAGNKPQSYDQQHTGQPNKGNLPSGPGSNVGVGSGCGFGSTSSGCSKEGTPLQKNTPIPSQTYGIGGSGPSSVGVGSKPIPTQVYGSGSGNVAVGSTPFPTQTHGTFGSGSGNVGVGSKPFPTQTHGTFGSGSGNIGFGNKPNTYDQQHTGLLNKANLPSGPGGNVGAGSACGSGSSSSGCSDEGTPLQKNTPIPSQTYGVGNSGTGHVGVGKKPIPTQLYGTGSGNVGVGSTSFPTQTHGTFGSGSGNIGFGNKPNSYDQQHTGLPNAGNLPSGPSGTSGVGSGCGSGSPSSGCSNEGTPLQKNTPIPSQTYGTAGSGPGYVGVGSTLSPTQTHGTFGSGSGNIGFGNKPNTYDQQHAGLPNKGNLPSGPGGNVGGGSGCGSGSSSSGCSNEGTPLQKNTPIPSQTYGVGGSGTGHLGVASKPIPTQVHGSGSGNVGVGSTPFPTQTHGTFGSGSGNAGFGNKPHSYDQQHTGIPNAGNLPSGPGGNVGGGSGCGSGSPSSGCSNEGTPLQKNIPIPSQTYGSTGSGPVGKKPIPTQLYGSGSGNVGVGSTLSPTQTHGTFGSGSGNVDLGNKPHSYDQHNIGQPNKGNVPSGPSGTVGVGSGSTSGESSAPCNDDGTPLQKNIPISSQAFGSASSGSGQSAFGNPNSYQFNTGNPFLYGGQPNSKPNIYPTSSPPFSNSLSTTVKPIGHGNPFLDGTITNTFGSQHVTPLGVTPIQNNVPNKPIGAGNPFLSSGGAGSSTFGTAIHPGINIENNSPSTVRPIGQNNPFFGTPSGNSVNKYPSGVDSNKNTPFGSGTSNPSSSNDQNSNVQFPKSKQTSGIPGVIGISSSGTYPNTNQGVKGGPHHNPTSGSVGTSSAGASSSGFNTPNSYNNNGGHGTGSLIGTANIKKPSYTLLNSPNSANDNGNNPNGQFNHQIANAGAQSFAGASAGASAGSYAGSFSSSQASSSSSSFASSKSGSYAINGDPNILHQLNGNWPINAAKSLDEIINPGWPSSNAGSQASAFASSSAGSWSGPQPFGVKSR